MGTRIAMLCFWLLWIAVISFTAQCIFNWSLSDLLHLTVSFKQAFGAMLLLRLART